MVKRIPALHCHSYWSTAEGGKRGRLSAFFSLALKGKAHRVGFALTKMFGLYLLYILQFIPLCIDHSKSLIFQYSLA